MKATRDKNKSQRINNIRSNEFILPCFAQAIAAYVAIFALLRVARYNSTHTTNDNERTYTSILTRNIKIAK
jgi:hypothetical protein